MPVFVLLPPGACRLGLYGALKDHGPCTAAALAQATGCHLGERYVVEWLRQQVRGACMDAPGAGWAVQGW